MRTLVGVLIEDWNGRQVDAATSRGGVVALARVVDNLMRTSGEQLPPAIVQKLYRSRQARAFDPDALALLERDLGYYCDLQSLHSEDAITWSFFGTVASSDPATRASLLRWLLSRVEADSEDSTCSISLWRRIPHPDTLVSGGPEIDAMLIGDLSVVFVEAKWRSGEGTGQGKLRDKGQMQLRHEHFEKYGRRIYGDRRQHVVGIGWQVDDPGWLTWQDLTMWSDHPARDEYRRYYQWKAGNSQPPPRSRRGRGSEEGGSGMREPRRPKPSAGPSAAIAGVAQSLGGTEIHTLGRGKPNWIDRVDEATVWVETERSRRQGTGPQPVPLEWIAEAYTTLVETGRLRRGDLSDRASKRSAFIFAILSTIEGVEASSSPLELRVRRGR